MEDYFPTFRPAGKAIVRASKRLFRALRWLSIRLAILIAAFLVIHLILQVIWGRSLEHKLADLRSRGEPVTALDLAPKPIPDCQNAAIIYQQAFVLLKSSKTPSRKFDTSDPICELLYKKNEGERADGLITEARAVIQRSAGVYPLLAQAASRPRCRFPVRWEQGCDASFNHLEPLRDCARLVAARAIIEARDDRIDAALDDVALGLRLSKAVAEEPTLISQMSRCTYVRMAIKPLREIAGTQRISATEARRVYDKLGQISLNQGFVLAMRGERAMMSSVFDSVRKDMRLAMSGG